MPPADDILRDSRMDLLERIVVWHVGAMVVLMSWCFGGQVGWARDVLLLWGSLGLVLFFAAAGVGRRWGAALCLLWPLLLYDALVIASCFYPGFESRVVDGEPVYRGLYANYGVADKPNYPRAEHPVVRTHPVTGKKALYVNRGFTRSLVGVPRDESDAVLRYLYEHMENPLFQCRFRWQENSIAFWDNRCVQHRAMWDYWPHTRSGNRVTVAGDKPY